MINIMTISIIKTKENNIIIMINMIIMDIRIMEEKRIIKEAIMIMIMIMANHIKKKVIIKADINKNIIEK